MAGISNIIGAYNINPKRVSSKLSFEVGQVFAARVVSENELNKEIILKLPDGWQFSAKLQNPLEFVPEGLIKFQVEGFQDGKLQIKIIKNKDEKQETDKSSLESLIGEGNIDVDKGDYKLLKNMIKHNMPLTKENIAQVKTFMDLREKLIDSDEEGRSFILKYVNSKNIDINSQKGQDISRTLKGFFSELKNISVDELLTILENGIEVNEKNIKSFTKIFKEDSSVYKELNRISEKLNLQGAINLVNIDKESETFHMEEGILNNRSSEKSEVDDFSTDSIIKGEPQNSSIHSDETELYKNLKKFNNEVNASVEKKLTKNDLEQTIEAEVHIDKEELKSISDKSKHIGKLDKNTIQEQVKAQLFNKTEEMKNIIKNLLKEEKSFEQEHYGEVFQTLKENINDFKVFNSVSNQYYYLDIPMNANKDQYECKLLIKDDRKSGKKIDSKNVSLVVSVKTISIGVVDAYIRVREQNMNIDIKCQESWIKMLSAGKDIISKELSEFGYNVLFSVHKKDMEANLINCRDFFEDNALGSVNVRV
jgi:hypothetical protein